MFCCLCHPPPGGAAGACIPLAALAPGNRVPFVGRGQSIHRCVCCFLQRGADGVSVSAQHDTFNLYVLRGLLRRNPGSFTYIPPRTEDRALMFDTEIRGQMAMLMGGRAAEELTCGQVTQPPRDRHAMRPPHACAAASARHLLALQAPGPCRVGESINFASSSREKNRLKRLCSLQPWRL